MNLQLFREPTVEGLTFGALWIDGVWQCHTLEDAVREVPGQPVHTWKIPRETAIPFGRYRVVLSLSNRFGIVTPEILAVPGYSGVRMHAGNFVTDTEGCPLVGRTRQARSIGQSRAAFRELMETLGAVAGDLWITIQPVEG